MNPASASRGEPKRLPLSGPGRVAKFALTSFQLSAAKSDNEQKTTLQHEPGQEDPEQGPGRWIAMRGECRKSEDDESEDQRRVHTCETKLPGAGRGLDRQGRPLALRRVARSGVLSVRGGYLLFGHVHTCRCGTLSISLAWPALLGMRIGVNCRRTATPRCARVSRDGVIGLVHVGGGDSPTAAGSRTSGHRHEGKDFSAVTAPGRLPKGERCGAPITRDAGPGGTDRPPPRETRLVSCPARRGANRYSASGAT